MRVSCVCTQCGGLFQKEKSQLNRALAASPGRLYCSRKCAGAARRKPALPLAERKARKAAYDKIRRVHMADEIRVEKREYHQRTYSYEKGRAARQARKQRLGPDYHSRYCRARRQANPALSVAKAIYDMRRRDAAFGDFSVCAKLLRELEREIRKQIPSGYERRKARGYYENGTRTVQQRKRNEQISRW